LKRHDNASQWSPGNYGFLEANAGPGAKTWAAIASTVPSVLTNGIHQAGQYDRLEDAFNVRSDS
jgi:hypothetical protein